MKSVSPSVRTLRSASECEGEMQRTQARSDRWFDVILENDRAQAAVMTLASGDTTGGPNNDHETSDQWLYVASGEGRATVDDKTIDLTAGDLVVIEAGETHEIEAADSGLLESLTLYVPPITERSHGRVPTGYPVGCRGTSLVSLE